MLHKWKQCVGWIYTLDKIGLGMSALEKKLG